jgi:predicted phage tail protein
MAPDWEKLSGEWEGHDTGFIAEVDCTTEGKPLCDSNGVKGFPSLKYGDPASLEDYQGSRTYKDLAAFATENLKPVCSPSNIDLCDDDKKKQIEEMMKLSTEEIETKLAAAEEEIETADAEFKEAVTKLQDEYQKMSQDKDDKIAAVKESGLGLLKAIKAVKSKEEKKEEL